MVDPSNPVDPSTIFTPLDDSVTQSYSALDQVIISLGQDTGALSGNFDVFNTILGKVSNLGTDLSNKFSQVSNSLQNMGNLTSEQTKKFGLISTAMLGAKESYQKMGDIDSSGLNTFTKQFDSLYEIMNSKGSLAGVATSQLTKLLKSLGGSSNEVSQAISTGGGVLVDYAKNLLTSADNQVRLQNAMMKAAGASGDLGTLYEKVGNDLTNFNEVSGKLDSNLGQVGIAVGENKDKVIDYAGSLLKVPGALAAMSEGIATATGRVNPLTEAMLLAKGTGQDTTKVIENMTAAVNVYGLTIEDSLKFTSRMTELSSKLNIPIDEVRKSLGSSADAFKFFTDGSDSAYKSTEGLTKVTNEYVSSLKEVGVTGPNALKMFDNLAANISKMGVAQKAFLSAQTGGPGGLLGSVQIDKMIKDRDIKGVFDKVKQQTTKMIGNLITVDEASKSQAGAAQLIKQRQILRSGPLGSQATTDAEADRLGEALKKGVMPSGMKLEKEGASSLQQATDRGTKIAELTKTVQGDIVGYLRNINDSLSGANLTTVQDAMSARSGAGRESPLTQNQIKNQESLKAGMAENRIIDPTKSAAGIATAHISKMIDSAGTASKAMVDGTKQTFFGHKSTAGMAVGKAAQNNNNNNQKKTGTTGTGANNSHPFFGQHGNSPIPVTLTGNTPITVQITGTCPHCGKGMKHNEQAQAINPSSTTSQLK